MSTSDKPDCGKPGPMSFGTFPEMPEGSYCATPFATADGRFAVLYVRVGTKPEIVASLVRAIVRDELEIAARCAR